MIRFPPTEIAIKIALSLGLGLLVGLEREWAHKDLGVRTFTITALLGMLASCAAGITVVGIDNGFGAAHAVHRILGVGR